MQATGASLAYSSALIQTFFAALTDSCTVYLRLFVESELVSSGASAASSQPSQLQSHAATGRIDVGPPSKLGHHSRGHPATTPLEDAKAQEAMQKVTVMMGYLAKWMVARVQEFLTILSGQVCSCIFLLIIKNESSFRL